MLSDMGNTGATVVTKVTFVGLLRDQLIERSLRITHVYKFCREQLAFFYDGIECFHNAFEDFTIPCNNTTVL